MACPVESAYHQSTLGKGITLVGKLTGTELLESLFIEGNVEGDINLPATRVTVSRDGHVTANIIARDIVVMGKIQGNLTASGCIDIRAQGFVTGMVSAPRVSMEDGAYLKGRLDVRVSATDPVVQIDLPKEALETSKTLFVRPKNGSRRVQRALQPA
jgi:cytoskeletal protein CcmA (bactofilin family)